MGKNNEKIGSAKKGIIDRDSEDEVKFLEKAEVGERLIFV